MYGWKRVIAWASSDSLGADTLLEFELSCKTSGIDVVKSLQFAPGDNDFTELLNEAKPYDVRIFAFLITNVADASNLLVQGFDSGVFNTLTMFFFTTSLQVNDNPMSVPHPTVEPKANDILLWLYFDGLSFISIIIIISCLFSHIFVDSSVVHGSCAKIWYFNHAR